MWPFFVKVGISLQYILHETQNVQDQEYFMMCTEVLSLQFAVEYC